MSIEIKYTGKNIEEAISQACTTLHVSRDQLDIKVLSAGSAGIFGFLRKKAVIQASVKCKPTLSPSNETKKPVSPVSQKPRTTEKLLKQKSPLSTKFNEKNSNKNASPTVLAEIKKVTETILNLMGYPVEVTLSDNQGKILVQLSGNHIETIIGQEGNTLDALQYLVRKIVSQKFSEKIMLSMDANNFRATRKQELEELAFEIARLVKENRKSRIIAPLNPAERRIIHVALQSDKTIRSKSIGDGLFKKIKVYIPGQTRKRSARKSQYHKNKNRHPRK